MHPLPGQTSVSPQAAGRVRAVSASLAAVAALALVTATFPAATALAESSSTGSAGAPGETSPAGANDWSCRPTPQHPRPVVLVHGTSLNMANTWATLSPTLAADGYCVFALNYGHSSGLLGLEQAYGVGPIEESAHELAAFVDEVRARTGAAQVDIVGHSQGGTMTRQYLRFEGPDPAVTRTKVHAVVMLGPSNHGTTFAGKYDSEAAAKAANDWPAVQQQVPESAFLTALNADGIEAFPGIDYTVIATATDETITPNWSSKLKESPGTTVHNKWIQTECGDDSLAVAHTGLNIHPDRGPGLLDHPVPIHLVRAALDPTLAGPIPC